MFESLLFSFANDFQRLRIELKVSNGDILYRIPFSENVDFVQKGSAWNAYAGDAWKWMADFESLDVGSWGRPDDNSDDNSSNNATICESFNTFPESEVKWSLAIQQTKEDSCSTSTSHSIEVSGKGSDSYPVKFADFLEMLKKLLNLPVLLLEL